MTRPGFTEWFDSLTADNRDEQNGGGVRAAGTIEFLTDVYDDHGPVNLGEVGALWNTRQLALAREAVDLVAADIRATTTMTGPDIDIRWHDDHLVGSFNGN